jgi:hypothetical protein
MRKSTEAKRAAKPAERESYMPAPKWRREKAGGISAPTFWRWRHDPRLGFPRCKFINGRCYVPTKSADDWLTSRPEASAA